MDSKHILICIFAIYLASAVPLNINLGAYSPALVVGDGEISFGGPEKASELLQTLATGAESGAVAAGTAPRGSDQVSTDTGTSAAFATASQLAATSAIPVQTLQGGTSSPNLTGTGVQDDNANSTPVDSSITPGSVPAEFISHNMDSAISPVQRYPVIDIRKEDNAVKHSESVASVSVPSEPMVHRLKRDIDGFREALQFARDAQKNQPKIVLGSGITQFPGLAVPVNSAANGALPPNEGTNKKRAIRESGEEKVGMTLIAIGEI